MAFLLDSNVLISHFGGELRVARWMDPADAGGGRAGVSVVTRIEVLGHSSVTGSVESAVRRLLDSLETFGLSDGVIERTVSLRRSHRLKLPDAIIAATALESSRVLVTHDLRGFGLVSGLRVIDPLSAAGLDDVPPPDPSTVREPRVRYRKTSQKRVRSGPVRKRTT